MLNKLLVSSVVLIGLTGFASAADLYVKAAPIYVPTWTGCYVGGHAGYGTEQSNDQYTFLPTYNQSAETPQVSDYSNKGFAGGGQVGCQLQTGTFLWGIEGDFTSFSNKDSKHYFTQYYDSFSDTSYHSDTDLSVNKSSLWSVRGRFGIINSDVYHLYATIGVGGERGSYDYSDTHFCDGQCTTSGPRGVFTPGIAGSVGISSIGLVFGAGAEWKVLPYIILRAEYLHYAIASDTPLPQNMTPITGILTGPGLGDHVHLGGADVVRVGASWLFNFGL
jgi:outer membrane immunogenic protein